jgi:hypothetical protein
MGKGFDEADRKGVIRLLLTLAKGDNKPGHPAGWSGTPANLVKTIAGMTH